MYDAHFLQAERAARVQEQAQFAQREAEWAAEKAAYIAKEASDVAIAQQVAALLQPLMQPQPQVPATQVPSVPDRDTGDKKAGTSPK